MLNAGSRYGLVGANGSGKTTFLNILSGSEPAEQGEVTFPKQARLGVLKQDRFLNDAQTILDVAMMGDEIVWKALREQDELAEQDEPDPMRIGEVDELINAHDGYALESRTSQILVGLGLSESVLKQPLGTLSGGYKLRVLLAQTLVGRPDALFLDEPTNHLDILSIRWLERFLTAFKGCAVIISHDQRFLNNVATHVLDVDYGTITQYTGNYDAFMDQKGATRERKEAEIARVEKSIAEKKAFVERFKAKATKARQAQSRVKQIEKIEIKKLEPSSRRYPKFRFDTLRPSGKDVLEVSGLSKAYGEKKVLDRVDLVVRRQERVAVIGANGLGKSTLLKIVTGHLERDSGDVNWGHEAQVGYFAQDHKDQLQNPEQTALNFLWDTCPTEGVGTVRGVLGRVLFSGDDVEKKLKSLSGGEATRLVMSRLMVSKPNVLVLDEPTNHLDLESIEALVDALEKYQGTLIFVSHDRWFVSRLATRIVEVRKSGLRQFPGSYDEYVERYGDDHLDAESVELSAKKGKGAKSKKKKRRLSNRERGLPKRRDEVVARLEVIEARNKAIEARYCEPSFFEETSDREKQDLKLEQERLGEEQGQLMKEWEQIEAELAVLERRALPPGS